MGHRYYDSRLGRFISQDPVGDGDNWYAYCDNDPINGLDPTGLSQAMGDFGYHDINPMSFGSSLFGGTYERSREVTDWKITNNSTGEVSDGGSTYGPWSDYTFTGGGMFAGGGLTPNDQAEVDHHLQKIKNITKDIAKRKVAYQRDILKQAERVPGDEVNKGLSRWGHRKMIDDLKDVRNTRMDKVKAIMERAGLATEGLFDDVAADFGFVYYDGRAGWNYSHPGSGS